MDHVEIVKQLPGIVRPYLPRNVRKFSYQFYDDLLVNNHLGLHLDPLPCEGVIVARTDDTIIIRISRTVFAIVDRLLATEDFPEGTKVKVTPYSRRHFDGRRLDAPEEQTHSREDGSSYPSQIVVLGDSTTRLPLPTPRCPELADLIEQLEQLTAPDGYRQLTHLLVDAGAKDFSCTDPLPDDLISTPPAIRFTVSTQKFAGQVTLLYERGLDMYAIELHQDDLQIERVDWVTFDMLGELLERLLDDGQWNRIQIHKLPGKSARLRH